MKCSLGISDFLEEISSLSHSINQSTALASSVPASLRLAFTASRVQRPQRTLPSSQPGPKLALFSAKSWGVDRIVP